MFVSGEMRGKEKRQKALNFVICSLQNQSNRELHASVVPKSITRVTESEKIFLSPRFVMLHMTGATREKERRDWIDMPVTNQSLISDDFVSLSVFFFIRKCDRLNVINKVEQKGAPVQTNRDKKKEKKKSANLVIQINCMLHAAAATAVYYVCENVGVTLCLSLSLQRRSKKNHQHHHYTHRRHRKPTQANKQTDITWVQMSYWPRHFRMVSLILFASVVAVVVPIPALPGVPFPA